MFCVVSNDQKTCIDKEQRRDRTEVNYTQLIVRALTFFFVCLFAALSFEGCSRRDPQRAKDDADRKAIVGAWVGGNVDGTFGTMRIFPDGTLSTSNRIVAGSSVRLWTAAGEWNITNDVLVITKLKISYWNWGEHPQIDTVQHGKIRWITDQELALAVDEDGFHLTNVLRRLK